MAEYRIYLGTCRHSDGTALQIDRVSDPIGFVASAVFGLYDLVATHSVCSTKVRIDFSGC